MMESSTEGGGGQDELAPHHGTHYHPLALDCVITNGNVHLRCHQTPPRPACPPPSSRQMSVIVSVGPFCSRPTARLLLCSPAKMLSADLGSPLLVNARDARTDHRQRH